MQKTVVNVNFNPMKGEEILLEYNQVFINEIFRKKTSWIHLVIGIGIFIYGILNTISGTFNPFAGVPVLETVMAFLLKIPFLFLFVGLMEITTGIASTFKKFFTLLYHHIGSFYSKTTTTLFVTNYRLIFSVIGEGGLGSTFTDIYYDQIEKISINLPQSKGFRAWNHVIIGTALIIGVFIPFGVFENNSSLFGLDWRLTLPVFVFGLVLILFGLRIRTQNSPYIFFISMNTDDISFVIILPPNAQDPEKLLNITRNFKFGGDR
jgi:hypothetical protein